MNKPKVLLLFIGLLVWSCEKIEPVLDNPLDPDNPDYEPPLVTIISGPSEGEVIGEPQATFEWEGNELVTFYRVRFDSNDWSDWSVETSKTFDYLDEGDHSVSIQSSYSSGDTSSVSSLSFVVDAVTGPALMFYPRRHLASVGETVTFQILAEEVENLTAAEFTVSFDPAHLEIVSITQGSMFTGNGESIFHTENGVGTLSILAAILGGESPSVDGTGDLALLEVKIKQQGTTNIIFDGLEVFKDPDNNDIDILHIVNGYVSGE